MTLQTEKIRNVGLVGHGGAGKTSLGEAMLYSAGIINRMGTIEGGNTVSDYHSDEIERKMSIHASMLTFSHNDTAFTVIDMPGYADFAGDMKGGMRVCDFALIVVDGVEGLQIGTERSWKYANEYDLPRMFCVNGLDHESSDYDTRIENLRNRWGNHIVPLQFPVDQGLEFSSVVDIVMNKMLTYERGSKNAYTVSDIPEEHAEKAAKYRQDFIETVAESDEALMEKYFDAGELSDEDLVSGFYNSITNRDIFPVVCSASTANVGVIRILEILEKYGPRADFRGDIAGVDGATRELSTSAPTSALVFKTMGDQHLGELSFFRVYSGSLKAGSDLKNCTRGNNERLNQIFIMNGKERHDISELPAGAIAAAVKLKNAHTDDTLCDARNAIEYPKTVYPMPCITFAMEPKNKGAEDKFSKALGNMHAEDPTFSYRVDSETNQTLVFGMGELHIITIMDQIKERYNIDVALNKPKVPFRETIRGNSDSKFRHKKQSGGSGQFAEVWMRVAPQPSGEGINFTESLVGQNVDRGFVPSVEKGVNAICKEGVLAKCTVVDVKIDFYDGKMHPVDSNDMSFQLAGRGAFKEAFSKAQPYLLEPICTVEINTPDQFLGDVMGDISSRRGQVQGMDSDGHFQIVKAQIPQANLYKYSTALRSMTHGTAEHAEAFSHYAEMPRNIEQEVIGELHVEV